MKTKQKKMLVRIILAAMLLVSLAFAPVTGPLRLALYLIPYLLVGYDILLKAAKGIRNGRVFDENFLMAVATLGAIAIALYDDTGEYTEAVAVMLFYQIGEWFQAYAVGKSRKNISDLMDIRPDYANIERSGKIEQVAPESVEVGTVIVVQPGEKVPIDGIVIRGETSLNTSALGGKSAEARCPGGKRHQRLHHFDWRYLCAYNQALRRFDSISNPGIGRKCLFTQITIGSFHYSFCPYLYTDCVFQRFGACSRPSASAAFCNGSRRSMG